MARNLREKIRALVNDAYDLRQESVVTKIENLITEELQLKEEERIITYYELSEIQSNAKSQFSNIRLDSEAVGKVAGDQPLLQALCLVNATISYLRSKKLLTALVKYQK